MSTQRSAVPRIWICWSSQKMSHVPDNYLRAKDTVWNRSFTGPSKAHTCVAGTASCLSFLRPLNPPTLFALICTGDCCPVTSPQRLMIDKYGPASARLQWLERLHRHFHWSTWYCFYALMERSTYGNVWAGSVISPDSYS